MYMTPVHPSSVIATNMVLMAGPIRSKVMEPDSGFIRPTVVDSCRISEPIHATFDRYMLGVKVRVRLRVGVRVRDIHILVPRTDLLGTSLEGFISSSGRFSVVLSSTEGRAYAFSVRSTGTEFD